MYVLQSPVPEIPKDSRLHQNSSIACQWISLSSCIRKVSASVSGIEIVYPDWSFAVILSASTILINQVKMTHGYHTKCEDFTASLCLKLQLISYHCTSFICPAWHQKLNAIEPWVPVHGGTKEKALRVSEDDK